MTKVPHEENIIKVRELVVHHPFVGVPITEPFCAVALAEYIAWGWKQTVSSIGDIHLIHANAPYRRA
jgi:hypothetical protein